MEVTDSVQGTYLELHTWYPYKNSQKCNAVEDTVPVNEFTVRNFSDFRRKEIINGYYIKHWQEYPLNIYVE